MKLVDLDPEWILDDGRCTPIVDALKGERFVGILFSCPCVRCQGRGCMLGVRFTNPIGGGPPSPPDDNQVADNNGKRWQVVTGTTFETLTISPSIDVTKDENGQLLPVEQQHWHGHIQSGVCT